MLKKSEEQPIELEIKEVDYGELKDIWGYQINILNSTEYGPEVSARKIDNHYLLKENSSETIIGIYEIEDKPLADKRLHDEITKEAEELQKYMAIETYGFIKINKFPFFKLGSKETIIPAIVDKTARSKANQLETEAKKS